MPPPNDSFERTRPARRRPLGQWLPLIATVTVATIGLAVWVWSERQDDEDDPPDYGRGDEGSSVRTMPSSYADAREGETRQPEESSSYMARMSGALKRTPSPQQVFDGASRTVVGGLAAASAVLGNALSSIREEVKNPYADHRTWSEEAELRRAGISDISDRPTASSSQTKAEKAPVSRNIQRKSVAIVISAASGHGALHDEEDYHYEHASILSHLPRNIDISKTSLFVLIYAPSLKEHPLSVVSRRPANSDSVSSSFTTIEHEQTHTPIEEPPQFLSNSNAAFQAVYSEAQSLVENETMIMPFTTPTGHEHMLRHLAPDIVYLQESLAGDDGEVVTHLQSWLRQDVVIVVGADGGKGGLADSESEGSHAAIRGEFWWEKEERVGRGRGVIVVESLNVGEDWARRVDGNR